ncbi:hypothetical protein B0J11DRAFT_615037 [Dendryphion nanum]|uniref:Uncharacterized protein n=1 Tax=Dendryphion nanum TaxID=256645 RepID=A0A9P9DWB5_9PLEO|nr:hypothetical protein B0J11DRAFT_615037 [Dendryphion nanum]
MTTSFPLAHISSVLAAAVLTFGGMIPLFNPHFAMSSLVLPQRITASKEAQFIMALGMARTITIGFDEVDIMLFILGSYLRATDAYICWQEGVPKKAIFRGTASAAIAP